MDDQLYENSSDLEIWLQKFLKQISHAHCSYEDCKYIKTSISVNTMARFS